MKRMLTLGIILTSTAALFAALPDGQQYFGRIKDATPIVTNGYTRAQIDAKIDSVKITEEDPVFTEWKTNDLPAVTNDVYTKSQTDSAISTAVGAITESDPVFTNKLATGMRWGAGSSNWMFGNVTFDNGSKLQLNNKAKVWFINPDMVKVGAGLLYDTTPTLKEWMISNVTVPTKTSDLSNDSGFITSSALDGYAKTSDLPTVPTDVSAFNNDAEYITAEDLPDLAPYAKINDVNKKADASRVAALEAWALGDKFKVVVTNYDVTVSTSTPWARLPAASFSYQDTANPSNYVVGWNELTRWDRFLAEYKTATNSTATALEGKADRAWGFYDSHTGEYAPDNYTWISSPSIAVAGGLSYEKHIASDGAIWVLTANGMTASTTGNTNGVFSISDANGNAMISIIKGDEQIVGAYQDGIESTTGDDGKTHWFISTVIVDAADSSAAPSLKCARTCWDSPTWYADTDADNPWSVTWSNATGKWVAEVVAKSSEPQGFFMTYYKRGAKSKIKHEIPTELTSLIINGVEYTLGTATINGNTVLTLTK